ncbi:MAG: hypothetical protein ACF8XB_18900, partial [Planctomycetota bacterium JB042]
MPWSRLILLAAVAAFAPTADADVSYRSLTSKEKERAFYAEGGRRWKHRRVHLHVPAARLLAKAEKVKRRRGGTVLVFDNRTVPLVVNPKSVYFRKMLQRARRGGHVCVKGTVLDDPRGGSG